MIKYYHRGQKATTTFSHLFILLGPSTEKLTTGWRSQQRNPCFVSGSFLAKCHFTVAPGEWTAFPVFFFFLLSSDNIGDHEGMALLLRAAQSTHVLSDFTVSAYDSIIISSNITKPSTQTEM